MPMKTTRFSGPSITFTPGGAAQPGDVARGRVEDEIDLARDQRRQPRRVVGDRREDDFLDVALDLAPVVRVALVGRLDAGRAARQHVRAGAVRVERRVALFLVLEVERPRDLVLLAPRLAHDPERVEVLEEDRVHRGERELDRRLVDLPRRADAGRVVVDLRGRHLAALHRVHDVVGRERRAVVELHALAQLEAPGQRADLLPFGREAGNDLQLAVTAGQALVDLAVHHVGHGLVLRVRVHGLRVALAGPAQRLRTGGGERQRARERESRRRRSAS